MKLLFVGDLACFSGKPPPFGSAFRRLIADADFAIANLEAPCCTATLPPLPKCGPSLTQPATVPGILREIGFTHVSLANNHLMDCGDAGLRETRDALDHAGLTGFGAGRDAAEAAAPVILEKSGMRVKLCAAAENGFGRARDAQSGFCWLGGAPFAATLAGGADDNIPRIAVLHAGLEEFADPLPEWRDFYRACLTRGATAVIAHHPHVPQGAEQRDANGGAIAYSLGNCWFEFPGMNPGRGVAAMLEISPGKLRMTLHPHNWNGKTVELTGERVAPGDDFDSAEYHGRVDAEARNRLARDYIVYQRQVGMPTLREIPGFLWRRLAARFGRRGGVPPITERERLWIFHNTMIETHRFIQQRALDLLDQDNRKDILQHER